MQCRKPPCNMFFHLQCSLASGDLSRHPGNRRLALTSLVSGSLSTLEETLVSTTHLSSQTGSENKKMGESVKETKKSRISNRLKIRHEYASDVRDQLALSSSKLQCTTSYIWTNCAMASCGVPEHTLQPLLDQTLCEHLGGLVGRDAKVVLRCNTQMVYSVQFWNS